MADRRAGGAPAGEVLPPGLRQGARPLPRWAALLGGAAQCLWGLPQTLAGLAAYAVCRAAGCPGACWRGRVVTVWRRKAGASLGLFLFVPGDPAPDARLLVHEYGHSVQSLALGPLYLPVIFLPSACWLALPPLRRLRRETGRSYYDFYTERWANRWGEKATGCPAMGRARID